LLLTLGLLLGSLWGKICWGHYWQWDPKEMWSLATWFVYAAYFHDRLKHGLRRPKALGTWLWIGLLFVVLTLTWINLSRLFSGMHTYA
jgi:ABC-type transport system involved in cytochrome c biogenesis permease subunit